MACRQRFSRFYGHFVLVIAILNQIDPTNLNLQIKITILENNRSFLGNLNDKINKNGSSKKVEKIWEANYIKIACIYVYDIISYPWIEIWNQSWGVFAANASKWTLKMLFFLLPWIFGFSFPDLRKLQFENVKLNLKFIFLELKLAYKPNFGQLSSKLLIVSFFLGRPISTSHI